MTSSPSRTRAGGGRRRPFRRALTALGAIALAAVAFASVARVPAGHLGATGSRLLDPGWRLKPPFARVRMVPLAGRLDAIDLDHPLPQGAVARLRLAGDYTIDPGRVRAARLASGGAGGLARRIAAEALADLPAGALDGALAGGGAPAPLPAAFIDMVARRLEAAGLATAGLVIVAGAPSAFAAAGPETAAGAPAGTPIATRSATGIRLLVVGLDGADWDLIDPLLRQGRMPRLRRLLDDGVRAPLRSYDPMISPLLWTTMVTGVGPDRHGVADFQAIEAGSGRRVPITSRFRRTRALWNMLGESGGTSAFVAWWASFPAEPVRGFQVSNLVAFETVRPRPAGRQAPAGLTWPRDYLQAVAPRLITAADLAYDDVLPILRISRDEFEAARREVLEPPAAGGDGAGDGGAGGGAEVAGNGGGREAGGAGRRAVQRPVALALSILTGTRNYAAIAADLAARRPDLTAVYFEGIDMMGHRFQHCMPPRLPICPAADHARFREAVTGFYALQDRLMGEVLDAAGPGTTVLVVSDHGFRSGVARPADLLPYTTQQPVEWHDPEGIFVLSGPGARPGARLATRPTLFDIAPTVLHLLGLPAGADMPGRVIEAALDPAFLAAHPPRRIPTWDDPARARPPAAEEGPGAREAEAEMLASLRALGYIGGDPDGAGGGAIEAGVEGGAAGGGTGAGGAAATTQVFYHRNLATYFMKRQEYARAVDELRLANQRQPLPKTWQMLSEALLALGRRDEAQAALFAALDDNPASDPEPVLWLVQLMLGAPGGRAEAEATARRYAARTAARPGLDDAIAGLLLDDDGGEAAAALARYRASFRADPLRLVVAQRLYALEPPAERAARLLPALRAAIARDPRLDEYQNLAGILLAESGRAAEAVPFFRRAVDLDPDNARFAANLGGALARLEQWPGAADAYGRALEIAPAAPTALKLGSALRRDRRLEEALAAFERAAALGDDSGGAALGRALVQSEMGRTAEAIATAERALGERPDDAALRRLVEDLRRRRAAPAPARPPSGTADPPARGPAP